MTKVHVTQVGNTMHVYDDAHHEVANREIEQQMTRTGHARVDMGVKQFVQDLVVLDTTKSGAAAYQWDTTGNRVKHARVRVTVKNGVRTEEHVRYVYKTL